MELVGRLNNKQGLQLGTKCKDEVAVDAVEYLAKHKMAALPEDYLSLLAKCNGAYSLTAELFGLVPDETHNFKDVVLENVRQDRIDKNNICILGANEFDYLVYDANVHVYQMRDKSTDEVVYAFSDIAAALAYLFNL